MTRLPFRVSAVAGHVGSHATTVLTTDTQVTIRGGLHTSLVTIAG